MVGLAMNPPHTTDERAVFTQLKPVRMPAADGVEEAAVFEDVKSGNSTHSFFAYEQVSAYNQSQLAGSHTDS
ncbi:hypothetical protein NQZ68_018791 [Dissostichus eleginoides]|nr:hypothetical protein NQZ68_018791 [Dissostichus eleginoides]